MTSPLDALEKLLDHVGPLTIGGDDPVHTENTLDWNELRRIPNAVYDVQRHVHALAFIGHGGASRVLAQALRETLDLGEGLAHRLGEHPRSASVADEGERMYVTLYVVNSGGDAPELVPIECVLGVNWIVTAYRERADVLEEFFERVQGGGQVGALDAPSFVATILHWIVSSYLRALDDVERELEDLDARVMTNTPKMATEDLNRLVDIRRTIGTLRRALAPHREVVVSLSHPELDQLSSEQSAQRFADLERRVIQALDAAREAKESTFGSFDLLVTRIGQRTNDIMKLLTLVTVILLPATVLGGIMGMNFQVGLFDLAWYFGL